MSDIQERDAAWFMNWMETIVEEGLAGSGRMLSADGRQALRATWRKRSLIVERKPEWFDEHCAAMFYRLGLYVEQLVLAAELERRDSIDAEVVFKGSSAFAVMADGSPFCPPPDDVARG